MKEKTEKIIGKIARTLAVIAASFFLLICAVQLYLLTKGGERIKEEIKSKIKSGTEGLYTFDAEEIKTSLFGTSIIFTNATLTADSTKHNELKTKNEADRRLYNIKVSRVKIGGINLINFLRHKAFNIQVLKIDNPEIKITDHPDVPVKEDPKFKFTLYALFAPGLSSVNIKTIELDNGKFVQFESPGNENILLRLENINSKIYGMVIDSTNNEKGDKLFSAEDLELSTGKILNTFSKGIYHLTISNLFFNSNDKNLSLVDIELQPQVGKFEFARKFGHEEDRINLVIDSITVSNLSVIELLQSYILKAGKVEIKKMNLHVFRDKRLKLAPVYKRLPQEIIRELELPLKIDTLKLFAERISYEEFPDKGDKEGNLYFTNINGKIFNISNIREDNSGNMEILASGYVFGRARLDAQFSFDTFNENNNFSLSGTLGETDPLIFNEMSVPVAGVEIKSGKISKMEFSATANSTFSEGTMKLFYEDLKLIIRDQETDEKKGLPTMIANLFVIKESNPENGEFREGEMKFERDTRKQITNFCWKTILSGMKSSIGMNEELSNEDE